MKKKPARKASHGGFRNGSGRKPGDMGKRVPTSFALEPDVIEYLSHFAAQEDQTASRSDLVIDLIRASETFKEWASAKENKK